MTRDELIIGVHMEHARARSMMRSAKLYAKANGGWPPYTFIRSAKLHFYIARLLIRDIRSMEDR